jgi:hypothetical protein
MTLNVPQQQAPAVNVQVPAQKAPVVNVSADSGLNYVNTILSLVSIIIGGSIVLLVIRSRSNKQQVVTNEDYSGREYVPTAYGYTLAEKPKQPTTAEYPDLFTRDKVRK